MDDLDRALLALLQSRRVAAVCGARPGLSGCQPGAAHERVRKLRERGVIRRTTIEVDPAAVGRSVLAFVMVRASAWMGDQGTRDALAALPEVQEAHVIAGPATLLLKIRTASTASLQDTLRRIFTIDGVASTEAVVVLETFFERPADPVGVRRARRSQRSRGLSRGTARRRAASMPADQVEAEARGRCAAGDQGEVQGSRGEMPELTRASLGSRTTG